MVADFEKQSYWHSRFAHEESFEWLTSSATFLSFLTPHLTTSQRILHLGSGTSDLHTHLRAAGHTDVTNVDYEPLALARGREMEARAFGDVGMRYVLADATRLSCADLPPGGKFDLVVDKSTVDAVACGGGGAVLDMARGVSEWLAPAGVWISLSYSADRFKLPDLPFLADVVGKILAPKTKAMEPDVFYWCYLLRPRDGG
ncbi:S-adenosyl-L-methionine-dependent methyltransferase [Xylaria telfairii]|nr:S-adenosyl-L-methionine-dependent methyltransferase [Xylaria telfairii]